jgi:hypothetical protein
MWTRTILIVPVLLTTGCSALLNPALDPYGGYRRQLPSSYAMRVPLVVSLPVGRWDNVMRLPLESTVDVLTLDGVPHIGAIVGSDAQGVQLRVNGQETQLPRATIVRVDLVDVAGSETGAVALGAAKGALIGAGAAALVGAVVGGSAWPPRGPFLRGSVALGAVAGGGQVMAQRQQRLIYLAPAAVPVRGPYGYGGYPGSDPSQPPDGSYPATSGAVRATPSMPSAVDLPACAVPRRGGM